jgi:hypothetical protein
MYLIAVAAFAWTKTPIVRSDIFGVSRQIFYAGK